VSLENPVAFTVRFDNDTVTDAQTLDGFHGGRLLKFDIVQLNNGNAYNASTGTFVAPTAGTYAFFIEVSVQSTG
jgi:hypothetical protein